MRRYWLVLIVGALVASSLTVLPVQAASAQAADEPAAAGTVVVDGGEVPDQPLAAPPDLDDPTDTDGDGVTDAQEAAGTRNPWPGGFIGMAAPGDPTDPADADSDDDGLSDGLEIGTDGGNRAGTGTDPNDADTDDDGVGDAAEVAAGTDARSADSDHDEVDDGTEAELGTDADGADSDFDGATDGAERAAGTDPLVSSVTGVEADGPFHFTDVPAGAYYEDAAYWATSDEVGALKRSPQFVPSGEVARWKLAQILRNYAAYLGRDTAAPPHSFTDIGGLRRRARAAVSWATANGIIPPTSPSTFTPGRTVGRAQLATALYRFAQWAGDDAAATPADDPYTDTTTLSDTTRSAIGWLALTGIIADSGAIPSPTEFKPKKLVTRAAAVSLLFQLDLETGTPQPTEDADGDGVTNLDEVQGVANPYPEPTDGGDVDPLDPAGQCLSPEPATDLPPTADGSGAPTDPDDPDSDDDGLGDGKELTELQTDPNDADTDNDCVSDGDEDGGFPLVLDLDGQGCPGGGGGGCPDITRYTSHSDPLDEDTDDDELPDHEEVLLRTDPELADTDLDGIDDYQEWNRWFTAPTSVDSDRDSRGGEGDQPPTPSLFDGLELRDTGTSPTLADTDGDGTTDFDEFDSPIRSMTVAELPGFEMEFAGGTSIRLRKERSADEGGAIEVGLSNSVESSTSTASTSSITQSETNSISIETGIEFGYASDSPHVLGHLNIGYGYEWGTDKTRETSTEESRTLAEEHSRTETEEWTSSEATVSGSISQGMVFRNTGTFTYELSDVGYTLYLRDPETQDYEVVGTMTVPLEGIVLAPGASTAPVQAVAEDVEPDLVQHFLDQPSALQFRTGNIEFLDSDGRNLEFLQESTFGQTAQVAVDFGVPEAGAEPRLETYSVSTNVTRDEIGGEFNDISAYPGVRMGGMGPEDPAYMAGVMDQIGYPRCEGGPAEGCYTVDANGDLESVDGLANVPDGQAECRATWVVTVQDEEQVATEDFDDVMVHAGDAIRLVRQTDCDDDSMPDNLEPTYGAQADVPDTDGDGLDDLEEAEGWIVGLPNGGGGAACPDVGDDPTPWASDTADCPWVQSEPTLPDTDGDAVDDREERDGAGRTFGGDPLDVRTDPTEADSDGDRLSDCLTPGDACGGLSPDPAPLNAAVRRVDATPCTTDGCWTNTTPNLAAAMNLGGVNGNADPRDDVRSVWVAEGQYPAPATGFELPGNAGVFGGFAGDERRLDDRAPNPTTAHPTVLAGSGASTGPVVAVYQDNSTLDGALVRGGVRGGVLGFARGATLANLEVANNSQPNEGGGNFVTGGGITWEGGADLTIRRSTVSSNVGPVGGVYLGRVDRATLDDSTVRNNLTDGTRRSSGCTTAPASNCAGGGGVLVDDAEVVITDSRIEDNQALVGGGLDVFGSFAQVRVTNTRITGNTAEGDANVVGRGGGLHAHGGADVLLVGSLLADNQTRVGPRWYNPQEDGFGGAMFVHDGADVRLINDTVTGNTGAGIVVAGYERGGFDGLSPTTIGGNVVAQNTIVVGNSMGWQAVYTAALTGGLGTQARSAEMTAIQRVAGGVLGFNDEWNNGGLISAYNECIGGNGPDAPQEDNNCEFTWFTGLSSSASVEVRLGGSIGSIATNGPAMRAEDSMIGTEDRAGEFGNFCSGLKIYGRTEEPTTANTRGSTLCGTETKSGLYLGLRGQGFQGRAIRPLAPPANVDELFAFPDYTLLAGTRAVDRGNQSVDWDPFTAGIQDAPETDLAGNPRISGRRIDLGAFELQ